MNVFFGQPFKDLDLAVSFQKLKEKVSPETYEQLKQLPSTKYDRHISCSFYAKFFFYKRFRTLFDCCYGQEFKKDEETKI